MADGREAEVNELKQAYNVTVRVVA